MKFTQMLKKNYEFRRLYSRGKSAVTPQLVVYCRKHKSSTCHLGITVSAKIGNAVTRNRVRRRLKEIYRLGEERLQPGYDIVVVARSRAVHSDYKKLEKAFFSACSALGLLKKGD